MVFRVQIDNPGRNVLNAIPNERSADLTIQLQKENIPALIASLHVNRTPSVLGVHLFAHVRYRNMFVYKACANSKKSYYRYAVFVSTYCDCIISL